MPRAESHHKPGITPASNSTNKSKVIARSCLISRGTLSIHATHFFQAIFSGPSSATNQLFL
jgi:hypothetical protein